MKNLVLVCAVSGLLVLSGCGGPSGRGGSVHTGGSGSMRDEQKSDYSPRKTAPEFRVPEQKSSPGDLMPQGEDGPEFMLPSDKVQSYQI